MCLEELVSMQIESSTISLCAVDRRNVNDELARTDDFG